MSIDTADFLESRGVFYSYVIPSGFQYADIWFFDDVYMVISDLIEVGKVGTSRQIHTGPSDDKSFRVSYHASPGWCKSTNAIGLSALYHLGFHLTAAGFGFNKNPSWFWCSDNEEARIEPDHIYYF